jgi:isopenicillin N synthase-like dioxygenase
MTAKTDTHENGNATPKPATISMARFSNGTSEERAAEIARFRLACTTSGCFIIDEHPFPLELIVNTFKEVKDFFALPMEKKQEKKAPTCYPAQSDAQVTSPEGHAYMLKGVVRHGNKEIPTREWLGFRGAEGRKYDSSDPYFTCPEGREFYSPESAHPEQQTYFSPTFKSIANDYYCCQVKFSEILFELLSCALDLPSSYFGERSKRLPAWSAKAAHYVRQQRGLPPETEVLRAHFDRDFITSVAHSPDRNAHDGSLLQVVFDQESPQAEWTTVSVPPGCFICFIGQIGGYWTNNYFRPCLHRVTNPPIAIQEDMKCGPCSIVCNMNPDYDTVIDPLPQCVEMTGGVKLFEKSWFGELYNWDSKLDIYDCSIQERLRNSNGLFQRSEHRSYLKKEKLDESADRNTNTR